MNNEELIPPPDYSKEEIEENKLIEAEYLNSLKY